MTKKITRTFPEFFYHLKQLGFDPSLCIDVGAASGTPSIYRAFPNAMHVVFEPLNDFQEKLQEALRPYAHKIHKCALMEKQAEMSILRQPDNLYTSSLMHKRGDNGENLVSVAVSTLDQEMAEYEISGPLLIKTDCQGSDLFVLKGGLKTLEKADIVIIETSLFKFWGPHHPDFTEIVRFMDERGFVVYDILDGLLRPYDKALGQVDLAFAKRNGKLREHYGW